MLQYKSGRVAEWLMALVLKTSKRELRRFESCPFRQEVKYLYKSIDILLFGKKSAGSEPAGS